MRSAAGRWVLITARTANAKAMSVAVGIAHPCSAPSPVRRLISDEQRRGHDHPADRGDHRQHRPAGFPQVTGDEFAFEFQAGDEEEDRQQPVGGPLAQGQIQMQGTGTDREVLQPLI